MHIWEVFCTLWSTGLAPSYYDRAPDGKWMQYVINLNPIYWYITSVRSCVCGARADPNMVLIPFLCAALSWAWRLRL